MNTLSDTVTNIYYLCCDPIENEDAFVTWLKAIFFLLVDLFHTDCWIVSERMPIAFNIMYYVWGRNL